MGFRVSSRVITVEDWAQLMDLMLNPDDDEVTKQEKYKVNTLKSLYFSV
jgi:hypothetical protein